MASRDGDGGSCDAAFTGARARTYWKASFAHRRLFLVEGSKLPMRRARRLGVKTAHVRFFQPTQSSPSASPSSSPASCPTSPPRLTGSLLNSGTTSSGPSRASRHRRTKRTRLPSGKLSLWPLGTRRCGSPLPFYSLSE
jgi:hypothetical protein